MWGSIPHTCVHASPGEAQVQVVSSYGLLLWRPSTASSGGEFLQTTTLRELKMTWTWAPPPRTSKCALPWTSDNKPGIKFPSP